MADAHRIPPFLLPSTASHGFPQLPFVETRADPGPQRLASLSFAATPSEASTGAEWDEIWEMPGLRREEDQFVAPHGRTCFNYMHLLRTMVHQLLT